MSPPVLETLHEPNDACYLPGFTLCFEGAWEPRSRVRPSDRPQPPRASGSRSPCGAAPARRQARPARWCPPLPWLPPPGPGRPADGGQAPRPLPSPGSGPARGQRRGRPAERIQPAGPSPGPAPAGTPSGADTHHCAALPGPSSGLCGAPSGGPDMARGAGPGGARPPAAQGGAVQGTPRARRLLRSGPGPGPGARRVRRLPLPGAGGSLQRGPALPAAHVTAPLGGTDPEGAR